MALIHCIECGERVSDIAPACPKCGYPIREMLSRRPHASPPGFAIPQPPPIRRPGIARRPGSGLSITITVLIPLAIIAAVIGVVLIETSTYSYYVPPSYSSGSGGSASSGYSSSPSRGGYYDYRTDWDQFRGGVTLCVAGGVFQFASMILFCVWFHKAWSVVPPSQNRPTPGKAVGLLFVPLFSLYWMFIAIPGLSTALDETLQERSSSPGRGGAGYGVGLAACIVTLIPFLNGIAFILFLVWLNIANGAKNRILASN